MHGDRSPWLRVDDPRTLIALDLVAIAIVEIPLAGNGTVTAARLLATVGLVLLAGQAVRLALVPSRGRGTGPASCLERWSWVIALGLVVPVLGVFVLDAVPTGINRTGWAVLFGTVTLAGGTAAWVRHGRPSPRPRLRPRRPSTVGGLATVVAVALAGAALWVGVGSAAAVPEPGFTQLYLVPRPPAAGPVSAPAGSVLGVQNFENQQVRYRVELWSDAATPVRSWTIDLGPGQQWQDTISSPAATHATLFRGTEGTPYRQVWLGR